MPQIAPRIFVASGVFAALLLAALAALGGPFQNPQASPSSGKTTFELLYPPEGGVLPAYGFLQTYIAVRTARPSTCYVTPATAKARTEPFTNTGNQTYHMTYIHADGPSSPTYSVECRDDATHTPGASRDVHFSFSKDVVNTPSNVRVLGTSPHSVLLFWTDPIRTGTKKFNIYRDGQLIGSSPINTYLDRTVSPDKVYKYSIAAGSGAEYPQSVPAPAYTEPVTANRNPAPKAVLDDFESGSIRVMNPTTERLDMKYFWGQYPFGDLSHYQLSEGRAEPTTAVAHSGKYSLAVTLTSDLPREGSLYYGAPVKPGSFKTPGTAYLEILPHTTENVWKRAKDYLTGGAWRNDTYNRLRFWVKVPPGYEKFYKARKSGNTTMDFGTYAASSHINPVGPPGAEGGVGGNHFYHSFRITPTDQWQQVIVDMHPSHVRGGAGSMEWGYMPYPTGEAGNNYFDLLTRFYIDFEGGDPQTGKRMQFDQYPVTFYFDDFEFDSDTNPENDEQVFSVVTTYIPESKEVRVTWCHPKDDDRTKHELRYSFQDIYTLPGDTPLDKWNHATPAPKGTVAPSGSAYNAMEYRTSGIPVAGNPVLYMAIKPQGAATFRQVAIPLGAPGQ
jgi:hypothetical protein